jgi:cell division protein FtsL
VTGRGLIFVWFLGLATLLSGVGVVYAKYVTRIEFGRLQALTQELHRLEEEWGLLRLEEAALSTHPRVEDQARARLGMYLPRGVDVRTIQGGAHVPQ